MQQTRDIGGTRADQSRDAIAKAFHVLGPVFFFFLPAGAATVMLGPLLPSLIHRWHIPDALAGTLFTAQFLGQLCGLWFGTRNLRNSVLYGALLSSAGCAAMTWFDFAAAPVALFFVGIGLGSGLAAGNVIAGTVMPAARTRLIALLNVCWSVGAILCPMLVRMSASGGVRLFCLLTAACLAVSALFSVAIPRGLPVPGARGSNYPGSAQMPKSMPIAETGSPFRPLLLVVFAASMFLYVGVENSIGGWLPSYAVRTDASQHASSVSFCFWMAELAGRLLVASLSAQIEAVKLYRACLALLIVTGIALCTVAQPSRGNMVVLAVLSGLALAPLYPLIITFMLARIESYPRLGGLFAFASLGGAIMPWITGIFSTHLHGLRAGLIIPAISACMLLIVSPVMTSPPATQTQA